MNRIFPLSGPVTIDITVRNGHSAGKRIFYMKVYVSYSDFSNFVVGKLRGMAVI